MYEHLLNLDSVFCPILSFSLEDMLFRIRLSDEVCVWETFSRAVIRHPAPWQTPVMVCGTRCPGQSACMKGKRRHLDVWPVESFVWCCMPFAIDVWGLG